MLTNSQGLVFATAIAVSAGTILLFDFFGQKYFPGNQVLKSCLSSGGKKRENKKRVRFADDVNFSTGNGELYRKRWKKSGEIFGKISCGNEIRKMPENHLALYSGILKDRVLRTGCSY